MKKTVSGRVQGFRGVESRAVYDQRAKRFPMTATVYASGRCALNRTALHGAEQIATSKGLQSGYHVWLEVNEESGIVGVHVVPVETPGSVKIRFVSDGTLSFSIDAALDELPKLRPTGRVKCSVAEMRDDQGQPFLAINLGAQRAHAKRPTQAAAAAAQS